MRPFHSGSLLALLLVGCPGLAPALFGAQADPPRLVILKETGTDRDGLPVLARHPAPDPFLAVLERGFSGRLLDLYRLEQRFLVERDGGAIEPAYLLLSTHQGGFPRFGFWLGDERKTGVGYVDLHERSTLAGRFGAMDQIFPHELMHIIVRQLAGEAPEGGANQVHAIAVRTDPVTAFNEGFAEHAQVLAIDDEDAVPETRALAGDRAALARALWRLTAYRRALDARWSVAPPLRMGFILWFGQTEQVLRYHGVRANWFAHEADLPERLLTARGVYRAYLLDNILPGAADGPVKPAARLLSTEGVIAALFWRLAVSDPIRQRYREPAFYGRFGTKPESVSPIANAYLKIFAALDSGAPHDTVALVRSYTSLFPDESDAVRDVVESTGLKWPLTDHPEIWLASDGFFTGTTLFDQFRARPRPHTFDLNAASLVDLLSVEGMSRAAAEAILDHAPYQEIGDLRALRQVEPALLARLQGMAASMPKVRAAAAEEDASLSLTAIVEPYLWRAVLWIGVCAAAGALLYRTARPVWWPRLAVNGLAAAAVGLLSTWVFMTNPWLPFLPLVAFGLPGAAWQVARFRSAAGAGAVLAAWFLACVPALVVTHPLF
jgi:hypothetical protein